jgi:hypothetical protein
VSFEEKRAWGYFVVTAIAYAGYVAVLLVRAGAAPLPEVAYVWPMVGSMGVGVVGGVVVAIIAAMSAPKEADKKDERDASIDRHGDLIGYFVLSMGVLGALVLVLVEVRHFWIGNAIYLAFVLSALVGTAAKLLAYRRGFAPW